MYERSSQYDNNLRGVENIDTQKMATYLHRSKAAQVSKQYFHAFNSFCNV